MEKVCRDCGGKRLGPEALAVDLAGHPIEFYSGLSVREALEGLRTIVWQGREKEIAQGIMAEFENRLQFLIEVGLDYLTLNRASHGGC